MIPIDTEEYMRVLIRLAQAFFYVVLVLTDPWGFLLTIRDFYHWEIKRYMANKRGHCVASPDGMNHFFCTLPKSHIGLHQYLSGNAQVSWES